MKWRFLFRKKREKKLESEMYYSEVKGRVIPGVSDYQDDFYQFKTFGIQATRPPPSSRPRTLDVTRIQLPSYTSGEGLSSFVQSVSGCGTQDSPLGGEDEQESLAYCPNCHTLVQPISKRRPKIRTNPWLGGAMGRGGAGGGRQHGAGGNDVGPGPCQSASVTDSGISEFVAQSESSCPGGRRDQQQFPKSVSDTFTSILTPQEEEDHPSHRSYVDDYECSPKGQRKHKQLAVESSSENNDSFSDQRDFPNEKQHRRVRRRKKQTTSCSVSYSKATRKSSALPSSSVGPSIEPSGFLQFSSSEHSTPVHRLNFRSDPIMDTSLPQATSALPPTYLTAYTPSHLDQAYENESLFSDTQTNISREAYVHYRRMRSESDNHPPDISSSYRALSDQVESLEELRLRLQSRIDQLHADKLRLEAQFSRASLTQDLLSQEIAEYRYDLNSRGAALLPQQYPPPQQHPYNSTHQSTVFQTARRPEFSCHSLITDSQHRSISRATSSTEQYFAPVHPVATAFPPPLCGNSNVNPNFYNGCNYKPPLRTSGQMQSTHCDNFLSSSHRNSQISRGEQRRITSTSSYGYTDNWDYNVMAS